MVTVVTHWTHEPTFASSMLHITATNGIVLRNAGIDCHYNFVKLFN